MLFKRLSKLFLTGFAALLPVIVTLTLLWWLASGAEKVLGGIMRWFMPDWLYVPGMGLAAGLVLTLLVGMLLHAWVFRRLFRWFDQLMNRIPLVKTVYGAVRDLMQFMSGKKTEQFNHVVAIEFDQPPVRMIGFVTREDFSGLPDALHEDDRVAVYMPMSYQIGGYLVMIERSRLIPLDMSLEDAMRFSITAGMSVKQASPTPDVPK